MLGIFFILLFPSWTACSPITYTNKTKLVKPNLKYSCWSIATDANNLRATGEVLTHRKEHLSVLFVLGFQCV